jgi:polysaccharide biosynthesis/export protein
MQGTAAPSWVLLLFLLTGCMTTGQGPAESQGTAAHGSPRAVPVGDAPAVAWRSEALTPAHSRSQPQDYRLGALDVIEISVFEVPELAKTVQVNSGGEISLPLIGRIAAGGMTTTELEREIERRLAQDYLQSPQASVLVKEYTSQRITVEGAVNSPGVFPISGRTTLLQAIAMAKGPDRTADESGVIVFRTGEEGRTAAVFDIGPIRTGQAPDPLLAGGDVVVVDHSAARTAWRDLRESIGVLGLFRPTLF